MRIPIAAAAALLLSTLPSPSHAIFEPGPSDFVLSTAGHGSLGVTYAAPTSDGKAVITSSSQPYPSVARAVVDEAAAGGSGGDERSGCHVSARSAEDGTLLWRRDACSSSPSSAGDAGTGLRHSVYASAASRTVYTLDDAGSFRGWNESTGDLNFDVQLGAGGVSSSSAPPRIIGADLNIGLGETASVVGAVTQLPLSEGGNDVLTFLNPTTGDPVAGGAVVMADASTSLIAAKVRPPSSSSSARVLGLVTPRSTAYANFVVILIGWVRDNGEVSVNNIAHVVLDVSKENGEVIIESNTPVKDVPPMRIALSASTIRSFHAVDGRVMIMGVTSNGEDVVTIGTDGGMSSAKRSALSSLHPMWTSIVSVHPPSSTGGGYLRIAGTDDRYPTPRSTVALFAFDSVDNFIGEQIYEGPDHAGEEGTEHDAVALCGDVKIAFEGEGGGVGAYRVSGENVASELGVTGDYAARLSALGGGRVEDVFLQRCDPEKGATILVAAEGGATLYLTAVFLDAIVELNANWSAEEALGSVSSVTFLDESHTQTRASSDSDPTCDDEEEVLLRSLSFSSRLLSQVQSLTNFFLSGEFVDDAVALLTGAKGSEARLESDRAFGFAKVAVMLNPSLHKLLGTDLGAGGEILWSMNLERDAEWHKLVHGGPSSRSGVGGGRDLHSLHGHEVLTASYVPSTPGNERDGNEPSPARVVWRCVEGLRGALLSSGEVEVGFNVGVAQVVPLYAPHHHVPGECRQTAALLLEDDTVRMIPDTAHTRDLLADAARRGNGLFAHAIDKSAGSFRSLKISGDIGVKATTVGETTFPPATERIVGVTYPLKNEVVQSPSSVLGDDSLLLKYLNPHLCVVVTEATGEFLAEVTMASDDEDGGAAFYRALDPGANKGGGAKAKTAPVKPLGATKPGDGGLKEAAAATMTSPPSLFINVMDTVSGRVLYRASHSHENDASGGGGDDNGTKKAITATKKSDVPVLISENWIVYAFRNARTQRTELGVLSLHEGMIDKSGIGLLTSPEQDLSFSSLTGPSPIVLTKTYGSPGPVSALGVTVTRSGISSKHILIATGKGGQVTAVDRRALDPRRPSGDPKLSEKMEGLTKYAPLLPLTPARTPSHEWEVSSATAVHSSAANVESQSLILAYGGPDVFFARLSPSRGFDLLPDDFNRPLLSAVVFMLVAVVATLKRMSGKKFVGIGWR